MTTTICDCCGKTLGFNHSNPTSVTCVAEVRNTEASVDYRFRGELQLTCEFTTTNRHWCADCLRQALKDAKWATP